MSRHVLHACSCGLRYDADEWAALDFAGFMDCGPGCTLELRQCRCGSTMARLVLPAPLSVVEEMQGKDAA